MKKEYIIVMIVSILIVITAIVTSMVMNKKYDDYKIKKKEDYRIEKIEAKVSDKPVIDECTDEFILEENNTKIINSTDAKVSINTTIVFKKYYKKCEHTINEYIKVPDNLINMNQDEVEKEFPDWDLIGFSSSEIVLYKEIDDNCGEHFLLKIENGKLIIYKILEDGKKELYENTEISVEYLPEIDLLNIDDGLEIYGLENLNQILEDFE